MNRRTWLRERLAEIFATVGTEGSLVAFPLAVIGEEPEERPYITLDIDSTETITAGQSYDIDERNGGDIQIYITNWQCRAYAEATIDDEGDVVARLQDECIEALDEACRNWQQSLTEWIYTSGTYTMQLTGFNRQEEFVGGEIGNRNTTILLVGTMTYSIYET